jgi:hypothetical protein
MTPIEPENGESLPLEVKHTDRGFAFLEFQDRYGEQCILQKSSLAFDEAIWFGISEVKVLIMAKDAASVGLQTEETTGWIDFPLPPHVLTKSRMHLTQDQVRALLPILQKFVDTGELE